MKIVPFPRRGDAQDDALVAQLEVALGSESSGLEAESWRELRADVRALAPPMSPELERELWTRIAERSKPSPARAPIRLSPRAMLTFLNAWLATGLRARLLAASGIVAAAATVTVAIVAPWQGPEPIGERMLKPASAEVARQDDFVPAEGPGKATARRHSSSVAAAVPGAVAATEAESSQSTPSSNEPAPEAQRVQQLGASITLAPKPAAVQSVATEVAQLAARDGGFVQSSEVHVKGSAGEANLTLSLPSARLSAALASLVQLAPMRAESQSLQDITDEYDADRTKVADAVAERQALLRALAKASTQGEIESLHARLALVAAAITRARSAYAAVSKRGSNSSVEVSVLGDAHAGSSESTLSKALHDASDVLKVALAVAIVALAVLVPLAILLVLLALGWRATRRRLRERVLSQR
jgi:Domain of unknown function (DUF4349)